MKVHVLRKKTRLQCPVCGKNMYKVYFHNGARSFMCLVCHFGFNCTDWV